MTTTHTARRIKRERTSGWTLAGATDNPLGAVIVDRSTRWGNPFRVADSTAADPSRDCAERYARWLDGEGPDVYVVDRRRYDRRRVLRELFTLRGRDIACTCPVEAAWCHGDVHLERANLPTGSA